RLRKLVQPRCPVVLRLVARDAQVSDVVGVVCNVPVTPVLVRQRNHVVEVNARFESPLVSALFAKPLRPKPHDLARLLPFGCSVNMPVISCDSASPQPEH